MRGISAIIVAGGSGKRLDTQIPKAFVPLAGIEMFLYSARTLDTLGFDEIIIVAPKAFVALAKELTRNIKSSVVVVEGGRERHNSVEIGVKAASGAGVLIHDAARPFITAESIEKLMKNFLANDCRAVISAIPVADTIRKFHGALCGETLNRAELIAAATPQIFDKKILLDCLARADELDNIPTDEAMLLMNFNREVAWEMGERTNFKITTPDDFVLAQALINAGFFNER